MSNKPLDPTTAGQRFGAEIKRRREALGLTQAQLADAAGISLQFLFTVEKGARDPGLDTMQRLAVALDVPLGELLGDVASLSPRAMEAARAFDRAEPASAAAILDLLRSLAKREEPR